MPSELLSSFILLALVIDPFGNVPVVNAMLAKVAAPPRRAVILRECLIATLTLGFFMVFGHPEGIFGPIAKGEPFIVPLAIPLIAGPSAIATVMLMANRAPDRMGTFAAALLATMAVTTVVLVCGARLQRLMG